MDGLREHTGAPLDSPTDEDLCESLRLTLGADFKVCLGFIPSLSKSCYELLNCYFYLASRCIHTYSMELRHGCECWNTYVRSVLLSRQNLPPSYLSRTLSKSLCNVIHNRILHASKSSISAWCAYDASSHKTPYGIFKCPSQNSPIIPFPIKSHPSTTYQYKSICQPTHTTY